MGKSLALIAAAATIALTAACSKQDDRYIQVSGGGFIFNYRLAEAFAGLVVVPLKELPEKSRLEATIENPAGGPLLVMQQLPAGQGKIEFTTDPLKGIVADKEYAVSIRLVAENGTELQRIDKKFHSQLDQSILPPAPLTVGPGYMKNPDYKPKVDTPGNG